MTYQFIGIPRYIAPKKYEATIEKIVDLIKNEDSIKSIYRLGNVNHPGISDIDLLVIFKNGSNCKLNYRQFLNDEDKYLLTHPVFGASEDQFKNVLKYSFWDNLSLIWGKPIQLDESDLLFSQKEEIFYKKQIGLEFMQKNYIELCAQKKYGVIKLRSLVQEVKGVRYDLDFLNIKGLKINECMALFLDQLENWFENPFDSNEFSSWLDEYYCALEEAVIHVNRQSQVLWVPKEENLSYGKNIVLKNGEQLHCKSSGIFLPSWILAQHKKIYNAHQRLNRFEITLKFTTKDFDGLNLKRFNAFKMHKRENEKKYPHFGALMTSLASQFI